MSATENNSNHLRALAQPNNTRSYCTVTHADTNNINRAARTSAMGGMVSAIGAVLCGTASQSNKDDIISSQSLQPNLNGVNKFSNLNSISHNTSEQTGLSDNKPRQSDLRHSYYHIKEDSDSEYCDTSEPLGSSLSLGSRAKELLTLPYMDEGSDRSQISVSEQNILLKTLPHGGREERIEVERELPSGRAQELVETSPAEEEDIVVSETEYSADEEQEEVEEEEAELSEEELERIDSDLEEAESVEEEHLCDSDCEHSDEELVDESESASEEDEDHICDSDCEHSDLDIQESESEYESEVEEHLIDSNEEFIELSENELSCDEEQESDSEEEVLVCECESACGSDCDGNHHECSSQCDCEPEQSDSEVLEKDTESELNESETLLVNGHHSPPLPTEHKTNNSHPATLKILSEITSQNPSLKPIERNNNRLQRNHSQKVLQRSNTGTDMIGELKTAIDARVRRSASCRETTSDYRKRFHNSLTHDSTLPENFSKLDVKEREARRKERRTRLRTLELKREQCLDELRDGTEEYVTERIYRDSASIADSTQPCKITMTP